MNYWHTAYRDHGPAVLAYLSGRMRREDAEDLLQETFVRAIRSREGVRDDTRLRPYLLTIARNLMLNGHRRPRTVLLSETGSGQSTEYAPPVEVGRAQSPEQGANFAQLEDRLTQAVAAMTPNLKRAFELAVLHEFSYKEIARQTGWSMPQVKVNIYRARQRAIAQLSDYLPAGRQRAESRPVTSSESIP